MDVDDTAIRIGRGDARRRIATTTTATTAGREDAAAAARIPRSVETFAPQKRSAPPAHDMSPDQDAAASDRLSLDTDGSVRSDGSRDAMCLCTPAPKIPRPRNAFILYRQHHQSQVIAENPKLSNPEISKIIGQKWKAEKDDIKDDWKRLAEEEKQRHQLQYPDYRYQPRRGSRAQGNRTGPSPTDDQNRCSKCSGRFISTPRTPATPFVEAAAAATPIYSQRDRDAMRHQQQQQQQHQQHMQHEYTTMASQGQHGPFAPRLPSVRDVEVWEEAAPEMKRRRANGAGDYHSVPVQGEHYRMAAGRMPMDAEREAYAVRRTPMTPYPHSPGLQASREQQQLQQGSSPPRPFNPAMPPPPRPSAAGPWTAQTAAAAPRRQGGGGGGSFDESLRLPPLQTAIPQSPRRTPLTESRFGQTPTSGMVPSSARTSPPRSFEAQIMTLPFKRKLEVLARVCHAAPTVGPENPEVETRGAFVGVEGHDTKMVLAVGEAVEKGLRASEDLALRVWAGDISMRAETKKKEGSPSDSSASAPAEETDRGSPVRDMFPSNCFQTILDWQDKVKQISRHITKRPPPEQGDMEKEEMESSSPATTNTTTTTSSTPSPQLQKRDKIPVALVKDGFSLTVSDRLACVSTIRDSYQLQDHWQWMASLWRGTICPDLVIYVKPSSDEEIASLGAVEFVKRTGLIVMRMAWGRPLDEAAERRIAFEVLEWVREGSFREGVPKMWQHEMS